MSIALQRAPPKKVWLCQLTCHHHAEIDNTTHTSLLKAKETQKKICLPIVHQHLNLPSPRMASDAQPEHLQRGFLC